MKKIVFQNSKQIYTFLFVVLNLSFFAQNFTWKKGSSVTDVAGVYGTQGTAALTNRPGSRENAATWTDAAGTFWLFGGFGYDNASNVGYLNDLWKYVPATNLWTWVNGSNTVSQVANYGIQGIYASTNMPGARKSAVSYKDGLGNMWLFGGYGYDNIGNYGVLNDLWTYDATTNQWRWMKGSTSYNQLGNYGTQGTANVANTPGARYLACGWTDGNGEFWLFGGLGNNSSSNGYLNDLWKYNPSTNQWIWVKGTSALFQQGVYGTLGTSAPTNAPGARVSAASFTDNSGNFWLIGGYGYSTGPAADHINDMWKFTVLTNEWTWIRGASTPTQPGVYGTQGFFNSANMPGARYDATTWLDGGGNLWLFGGNGYAAGSTSPEYLNDLWRYDLTSNQWKWVRGSNTSAQQGNYGVVGVNTPFNMPGARGAAAKWKDSSNNLWLFGGIGYAATNNPGKLSDLWKFDNCIGPHISIASTSSSVCAGDAATLTVSGGSTYTWTTGQVSPTLVISPNGTTTYTAYGMDANECRDTTAFTLNIHYLPVLSVSSSNTVICPYHSAVLTASGAVTYTWSNAQSGPTSNINPSTTTVYTVTGRDSFNCSGFTSFSQSVALCVGIESPSATYTCISIFPNPSKGEFTLHSEAYGKKDLVIVNALGQKVFEQTFVLPENTIKVDLEKGIYIYKVTNGINEISIGRLIIEY